MRLWAAPLAAVAGLIAFGGCGDSDASQTITAAKMEASLERVLNLESHETAAMVNETLLADGVAPITEAQIDVTCDQGSAEKYPALSEDFPFVCTSSEGGVVLGFVVYSVDDTCWDAAFDRVTVNGETETTFGDSTAPPDEYAYSACLGKEQDADRPPVGDRPPANNQPESSSDVGDEPTTECPPGQLPLGLDGPCVNDPGP